MELTAEKIGDVAVVKLPITRMDASNADEFKRNIVPLIKTASKMVFDLSQLNFVDSSALGAILTCLRRLKEAGGDLKICGLSKSVRIIFELVRFHKIMDIYGTQEEAVNAFQR